MIRTKNLSTATPVSRRAAPARIRISSIQADVASFVSPGPKHEIWRQQLETAFGSASPDFIDMTLHHLERAARMPGAGPSDMAINGAIAMIAAKKPRDEADAALAVLMACTYMMTMSLMARVSGGYCGSQRLPQMASAIAKLNRAYCVQSETFRRQRSGGDQNIRVEHVHVHEGGQAIVGGVVSRSKGE